MGDEHRRPLGRILLQQHAISQPDLDRALSESPGGDSPLASRLTESGAISEVAALKALSEQSGVPGIDLNQVCIRLADIAVLPREIALRHRLLPVLARDDRIFVAMATPADKKVIDELEFVTGKRVYPYVALSTLLVRTIHAAYELRERGEAYYVGPRCPPEILRKVGVASARKALEPEDEFGRAAPPRGRSPAPPSPPPAPGGGEDAAERSFRPSNSGDRGVGLTPVVVDDQLNRFAIADELTESDFGRTEASVVTQLPPGPPPDGRRTVLVVDDEQDIRRLLRRVLEERGFRVLEADRGQAALRLVKDHTPDVMVLDAMLPEVHGFDIARRIKGTERYGHIPIIMVSAVYRGWRIAEDLKASYGVDAYIEKPFRVADVVNAIEAALQKREHASEAVAEPARISSDAERCLVAGIAAYQAGDVEGAIAKLREGTHIDPLASRLHFHLGLLYGKQGNLYDAIQQLETAVDLSRRHFPGLKNLAVLYQKAGFRNKAIETWERALAVAPDEPTRQSIKEHLLGLL